MASASYAIGVRTRFRNTLEPELKNGKEQLKCDVEEPALIDSVAKCMEKVESQTEKLVLCMEGNDEEEIDGIISTDCDLCFFGMKIYIELKQFKKKLVQEMLQK